jgi:3-hydroxyacyl-CoA dehydrogenase/enoyl-CoA hydratase/3-hydroxybutyryl-CoA epimerase
MMSDSDPDALKRGVQVIRGLFEDMVKRGQMTGAAAHKAMGGIGITTDLRDFADCDLVIEAVVEDVAVKRKLFTEIAAVVPPDCLLASNTSALPIEEIMSGVREPGRTVGLHFFNPVGRMPLVEVVLAPGTKRATAERALGFVRKLGKTPIVCRSAPGFYVTRALFSYLNAACQLWEEGVPAEAIDAAMRDWGWPMGPLRLIDEVGLDVTDFIYREMAHYFPGRFTPTRICGQLLAAGLKGRKNGASAGFYEYGGLKESPNPAVARFAPAARRDLAPAVIQDRLNGVLTEESQRVLAEGVLKSPDDADLARLLGAGFPAWRGGLLRGASAPAVARS